MTVSNKFKTFSFEQLLYFDQPFDLQSNSVNLKAKSFVTRLRKPLLDSWSARGGYVDICRGGGSALGRRVNGFEENDADKIGRTKFPQIFAGIWEGKFH